ncbi:peptidoglycan D,D-transpeptidase FtsI family protein [Hydrogenovibrio kuenenii]|uniref:peptidoglycan D,D-transpeptidase FtsI family protein n=1 Tax=Hydrogenovibrio kuenenii TaxID=63658 RepID=UPI0004657CE9|nr:penicillin-binding protein 2 [Hydrogenovibrio kuenenii]
MNNHFQYQRIKRDTVVYSLVFILFMVVLAKAFDVQIVQSSFLQNEGNKRQIRTMTIPAPRGEIYDRNGNLLALSTPIDSIWVDPKILSYYLDPVQQQQNAIKEHLSVKDVQKQQAQISQDVKRYKEMLRILGLDEKNITQTLLAKKNKRFLYIKRSVLPPVTRQVENLDVPGVFIQNQYKRYYPAGEILGHVVGFTNIDDKGISGIEKAYDKWLTGQQGKKEVIKDRAGRVVDFVKDLVPAKPGHSITLSIDKDIQFFLYHALKKAYIRHQAKSVQSVILDAKTGEILGMATIPSFNPNNRSQLQGSRLRNRVITDVFEPGSPAKPFIISKALDLGLIKLDTIIDTSPGAMWIQGQRITDTSDHGKLTPQGIIEKSSNIGASKVAFKMTPDQEWQMLNGVGFGQDLGIYLPGESIGYMKSPVEWQKIDQASASFGYGFNINLLQLARAYTIFANHGVLEPVSILKLTSKQLTERLKKTEKTKAYGIKNGNEKDIGLDTNYSATEVHRVISAKTADEVLAMMQTVVSPEGTAKKARIPGYTVAGKTGTVHKTKVGGYHQNEYFSVFVGLVPASNPKYVMATVVNEPSRGVYYGGLVAAPIFKEVMQDVLRIKNVPPDQTPTSHKEER